MTGDAGALDRIAHLLAAEEWPGACAIEDVAAIVAEVRPGEDPRPDAHDPRFCGCAHDGPRWISH